MISQNHMYAGTATNYQKTTTEQYNSLTLSTKKIGLPTGTDGTMIDMMSNHTKDITNMKLMDVHGDSSGVAKPREIIAWTLTASFAILFTGSLILSITLVYLRKKRPTSPRINEYHTTAYQMNGNPCYEPTNVVQEQTSDFEENLYESV